jgi:hypothetical protein
MEGHTRKICKNLRPLYLSYFFNAVTIKLRLFCEGKASGYPLFVQAVSARWVDTFEPPPFWGIVCFVDCPKYTNISP